jgi:hypothetical protein
VKFTHKDRQCRLCHSRPAKFRFQGKVKRDKDHELCFQCFRSVTSSNRAVGLSPNTTPSGFVPVAEQRQGSQIFIIRGIIESTDSYLG